MDDYLMLPYNVHKPLFSPKISAIPTLASAGISCRRVVCLSVRPVRPSVTSHCTRLNVGSRKERHPRESSLLTTKIMTKLKRTHPQRRCQMQVGYVKCS